ncbi:FGGY family carbohydrate kinase [Komagataeibacter rhaeticus]|nr:FGGY family carbohydrate kinase [Komagataeibacter rhaeticus]
MFVGIDLGTSGLKAVLVDGAQRVLASYTHPCMSHPHAGWNEQAPGTGGSPFWPPWTCWPPAIRVKWRWSGALACRASSMVPCCWGRRGRAASMHFVERYPRHSAMWEFERRFPEFRQVCGNMAMPGFTAPKLIWVAEHEPDVFRATRHVLLPKAWLRYRMTGEMIEDMSDASGSLWLDVGRRCWSDGALAACGLETRAMPALVEGTARAGALDAGLARRWG